MPASRSWLCGGCCGGGVWLICGLRAAEYFSASSPCSLSVVCSRSRIGTHQVIGDFLCVGCCLVNLLRVFFQRLQPAGLTYAAPRLPSWPTPTRSPVIIADISAREFFAGVLHAVEVPRRRCFKRVAVHPLGVAGGVAEFV